MKQFFTTVAGVFVGLVLFFVIVPIFFFGLIISSLSAQAARTPKTNAAILDLDLRQGLTDQEPPFALFGPRKLAVMKIIATMRRAETDPRVKSILVRLPEAGMEPAEADELRLAFIHFRKAGKPILAYSQGLYPEGMVASTYELGAASGELWMQGESGFQVVGAATSDMFLKRFFDKHDIKADFEQRYEYKNAVNPYLYSGYTPAHREATLGWMNSVFDTALNAVAADRRMDPAKLRQIIVAGPYSAPDALAKGLIDKVGGVHDAEETLKTRAGDDAKIEDFSDYISEQKAETKAGAPTIAVVEAEGDIITGRSKQSAFSSDENIYSDDTAKAFYDAIANKSVKAIVFRVNSPGGVDTASEQILQAVMAAQGRRQAGRGLHGHLRGLGRLLDLVPGERDRGGALDPDRLDRRVRRQVRARPGPFEVRRRHGRPHRSAATTPTPSPRPRASPRPSAPSSPPGSTRPTPPSPAACRKAATSRSPACARSPRAASGPGPRPCSSGWSTSSAASTTRWTRPRRWPASRRRRRWRSSAIRPGTGSSRSSAKRSACRKPRCAPWPPPPGCSATRAPRT